VRDVEALSGLSRAKRLRSLSLNLSINALNAGDTQACGAASYSSVKRVLHTGQYFSFEINIFFASMHHSKMNPSNYPLGGC